MTRWLQRVTVFLLVLAAPAGGHAQTFRLPEPDRRQLAEAFRLAEAVRATVWPGWERTSRRRAGPS